jgi:class 3 adenylate cyclase
MLRELAVASSAAVAANLLRKFIDADRLFEIRGEVGFEGRSDYAALGTVTNLAARLSDEAAGGQILVSRRLLAEVEENVDAEPVGEYTLKGFSKPLPAFNILGLRERAVARG